MITIKTFIAGPIQANNYLVIDNDSNEAVLIDCSERKRELIDEIKTNNINVKYILLTHGHFDHVLGVNDLQKELNAPAYLNKDDISQTECTSDIMETFGIRGAVNPTVEHFLKDGDEFSIGNTKIKAIATPGHTEGGMCYLIDGKLFSGDTLFKECVGRTDLTGGNFEKIRSSVLDTLFKLDDDTIVYPGHGSSTTIGYEKQHNEILNY